MIIVSLGTHERPFIRLVEKIEHLIQNRKIREQVIIQLGYTKYKVSGAKNYDFIPVDRMRKYIKNSNVMITHGGVGSIVDALSFGKSPIVVPRRKELNEHSDDHQMQVTKEMEKQGIIIPVYDIKDLENAINKARKFRTKIRKRSRSKILDIVEENLNKWEKK